MAKNSLKRWYEAFVRRRDEIVAKEGLKTPEEIAEFFTRSNLQEKYPDFCPMFAIGAQCHDMPDDKLNCYFCACPYYDYEYIDEAKREIGRCKINSKYGERCEYGDWHYWDCSKCLLPHRKKFVVWYLRKKQS